MRFKDYGLGLRWLQAHPLAKAMDREATRLQSLRRNGVIEVSLSEYSCTGRTFLKAVKPQKRTAAAAHVKLALGAYTCSWHCTHIFDALKQI